MSARLTSCALCLRMAFKGSPSPSRPIIGARHIVPVTTSRPTPTRPLSSEATASAPQSLSASKSELISSEKNAKQRLVRIVTKELRHMDDPYQIGKHVEVMLSKNDFEHALLLTQQASKDKRVVVAWNHLISYLFAKNNFKKAIKTYNEMKKRGQLPNVQTFTVLFRGCSRVADNKQAVSEAFKHYNILLQDRRLEPNTIHLNAVLNVCARAGDIDAMFLVAKSINDTTRAADAHTYTTIFNGMRHHLRQSTQDLGPARRAEVAQKLVDDAKRIWVEVLQKWNTGKLQIDEDLVCAMGRLMLNAPPTDTRVELIDVFELLQQTMNLPNFAAASIGESHPSNAKKSEEAAPSNGLVSRSGVYVEPSRNTLSLILTAAAYLKSTARTSTKYWNLLVNTHGVQPDEDNWLRMLRTLKVSKSSAEAASVISLLNGNSDSPLPFRVAMETCVRDNINPNIMANATKVLEEMAARCSYPDPETMRLYVRVALVSHFHQRTRARDGGKDDAEAAKREYGIQIMKALEQLWEPYKAVHSYFFKNSDGFGRNKNLQNSSCNSSSVGNDTARNENDTSKDVYNGQREVIALARLMYSAANKVINENMVPHQQLRVIKQFGGMINREIQSFFSDREDREPKLRDYNGKKETRGKDQRHACHDELTIPSTEGSSLRQGGDFVWNTTKPAKEKNQRRR